MEQRQALYDPLITFSRRGRLSLQCCKELNSLRWYAFAKDLPICQIGESGNLKTIHIFRGGTSTTVAVSCNAREFIIIKMLV